MYNLAVPDRVDLIRRGKAMMMVGETNSKYVPNIKKKKEKNVLHYAVLSESTFPIAECL